MFITRGYPEYRTVFESVSGCLIFWPKEWEIPERISVGNAVVSCENPHLAYCQFYQEQKITGLYQPDKTVVRDSSLIAMTALIGEGTVIFPGCYIGGQVSIGRNCFIGAGVKIVGHVQIGDNVWIRENTVIGTDGMSTDRDENGHPVTMPQFGGVVIEDDVQIGANACILRGAIDDTVLHRGCKIDSLVLVSHNVSVGEELCHCSDPSVRQFDGGKAGAGFRRLRGWKLCPYWRRCAAGYGISGPSEHSRWLDCLRVSSQTYEGKGHVGV